MTGIEPATSDLSICCSANELHRLLLVGPVRPGVPETTRNCECARVRKPRCFGLQFRCLFHLATSPLWGWLDSNQHLLVGPHRPGAIQSRSPESNRDVQRASA